MDSRLNWSYREAFVDPLEQQTQPQAIEILDQCRVIYTPQDKLLDYVKIWCCILHHVHDLNGCDPNNKFSKGVACDMWFKIKGKHITNRYIYEILYKLKLWFDYVSNMDSAYTPAILQRFDQACSCYLLLKHYECNNYATLCHSEFGREIIHDLDAVYYKVRFTVLAYLARKAMNGDRYRDACCIARMTYEDMISDRIYVPTEHMKLISDMKVLYITAWCKCLIVMNKEKHAIQLITEEINNETDEDVKSQLQPLQDSLNKIEQGTSFTANAKGDEDNEEDEEEDMKSYPIYKMKLFQKWFDGKDICTEFYNWLNL